MDILTHLLSGYLISYWASGSPFDIYIIFGTMMAAVPDVDVLLAPLRRRLPLPLTGHHGATHLFIFVILFSTIIYILLNQFFGISDLKLLLLMCLTGSVHILEDFIGTGAVYLLYPYKKKQSKLNLEVGASPVLAVYSLSAIALLLAINLNIITFIDMWTASILVAGIFVANLAIRATLKHHFSHKAENQGFSALPTIIPYRWKFARRTESEHEIAVEIKYSQGIRRYVIPKSRREKFETCEDLVYTYWLPQVQAKLEIFDYPYYQIECGRGKMEIIWRSAEMGRVMEVKVTIVNGSPEVKTDFNRSLANYIDDLKGI
jgi:membrane-bound metal-dependent hydrolase YbcI (DUF457 family)